MSEVGTLLRDHYEAVAPAIDIDRLIDELESGLEPPRPQRRLRGVLVAAAAALIVIGLIGAIVLLRGPEEPPPVTEPPVETTVAPPDTTEPAPTETTLAEPPPVDSSAQRWASLPMSGNEDLGVFDMAITEFGSMLVAVGAAGGSTAETVWLSEDGITWIPVDIAPDHDLFDVVVGGPGLVAVGQVCEDECVGAAWTSPDGFTWTRVPHDGDVFAPETSLEAVTAGGPGLVAVGSDRPADVAAVWTSADGTSWTRVPHDPALFGTSVMTAVSEGGPGVIAVGVHHDANAAVVWISADGTSWTRVPHDETTFGTSVMQDITQGRPGLVAVGVGVNGGATWTSPDGLQWTRAPDSAGPDTDMQAVIAGGPGLIAVGIDWAPYGTAIWTSSDGLVWTRVPNDPITELAEIYDIAAGGPGFVAVGEGPDFEPRAWVSPPEGVPEEQPPGPTPTTTSTTVVEGEAVGWERVLNPGLGPRDVTLGGPGLVAAGHECDLPESELETIDLLPCAATVWTSADGASWTSVPPDQAFDAMRVNAIAAGGPGLVVVGSDFLIDTDPDGQGIVLTSADGLAWQRIEDAALFQADVRDVTEGGPGLVAVGGPIAEPFTTSIWLSEDGSSWEAIDTGVEGSLYSVANAGDILIAVGDDGSIRTSPEGRSWEVSSVNAFRLHDVTAGPTGAITTDGNTIWFSPDALTWVQSDLSSEAHWIASVATYAGGFVAVGQAGTDVGDAAVWTSIDGLTWKRVVHDPSLFAAATMSRVVALESGVLIFGDAERTALPDGRIQGVPALWSWTSAGS